MQRSALAKEKTRQESLSPSNNANLSNSMLGPGAYNTIEEENIKRKYIAKYDKLFAHSKSLRASGKGIVKVGKNLAKATEKVPEFEETQRRLQDQLN